MKKIIGFGLLILISTNISLAKAEEKQTVQFICAESYDQETEKRAPTTFAWTPRGSIAIIRWTSKISPDPATEKLCGQVANNFQETYDNNSLALLTTQTTENQTVICTTKEPKGNCETILFSLCSEEKPIQILSQLKSILNGEHIGTLSLKRTNGTCPIN